MKESIKSFGRFGLKAIARLGAPMDRSFLADDVPLTRFMAPRELLSYLESTGPEKPSVLEIGSREVTGASTARRDYADADYVGFDYYPGRNVDVTGDVHRLSSYFEPEKKFDLVFSFASFEHFAMPWIVALEVAKMMKVGGILTSGPIFHSKLMSGLGIFSSSAIWACVSCSQARLGSNAWKQECRTPLWAGSRAWRKNRCVTSPFEDFIAAVSTWAARCGTCPRLTGAR